jgi:hypothetical protein
MINGSVAKAYNKMFGLAMGLEKAEEEGGIKKPAKKRSTISKRGLLSRSDAMNKNKVEETETDTSSDQQQLLVLGYMMRIKKAFEEVKNGRANTKS